MIMRKIQLLFSTAAVMLVTALTTTASAQTTPWKGASPESLAGSGEQFFLYNVGTGKFVTAGNGWGTEAALKYSDYGSPMTIKETGGGYLVLSGFQNSKFAAGKYLGINYPEYTTDDEWGGNGSIAPIMEAQDAAKFNYINLGYKNSYSRSWTIAKTSSSGNNTYSFTENIKRKKVSSISGAGYADAEISLKLGAVYGMNSETVAMNFVGNEQTAFTSGDVDAQYADYYKWQLVPVSEFEKMRGEEAAAADGMGQNENMTYLLKDPFFDRNNGNFGSWDVFSTATGSDYRYDWQASGDNRYTEDQPWNTANFRRIQVDTKAEGKYAFGSFEGAGSASQTFNVPAAGVYRISCRGFYNGANAARLFVKVGNDTKTAPLVNETSFSKTNDDAELVKAGKALYENAGGKYTVNITVKATEDNQEITIGVMKDGAAQSDSHSPFLSSKKYYYDTDYTGVDNFQIVYLGKAPFVLDDTKADGDSYIEDKYTEGNDNVGVVLSRKFTTGKWNTMTLPVTLTAAQLKNAFGDDVKIAKLEGIGARGSIDFKTVSLENNAATAIEAGKMYLIKPLQAPLDKYVDENGNEQTGSFYALGRCDFSKGYTEAATETSGDVKAIGNYGTTTCPAEAYAFSGGNMYHLTSPKEIKGFRGWFENTSGGSIKFNVNGEVTAIENVSADKNSESGAVYTVDGIKVRDNASSLEGLPAGLYIFKGKTHLVK